MKNDKEQKDDIMYFVDKAIACCDNNDVKGAKQALKRLKLMEDALIVYKLTKSGLM